MSHAIPVAALPNIHNLVIKKEQELNRELGSLRINDVKEDGAFKSTTARIKNLVRLTPVDFGEPVIKNHRSEIKKLSATYNNPWPHEKEVITVAVDFPFTGSPELFSFSPNGMTYGSSDTRVYQPDGNNISIEVEVEQLNKDVTLSKARSAMKTTFSLINQINPQAAQWSLTQEPLIDAELLKKRKELVDFYG